MIHQRAYKFRIYPTHDQMVLLNKTFGCVRFYWNHLVNSFNNHEPPSTEKELRQEYDWLMEISATSLQQKRRDFDQTKNQYFSKKRKKKLGRMKLKKKGRCNDSYRLTNQKFILDQSQSLIRLEKIGYVKYIQDRMIPSDAKINSCTISRNKANQYCVSVQVEENIPIIPLSGKYIGIDLGLKDLFTGSDGIVVTNPSWFRKNQTKLSKAQRHLSRKCYGSNRYNKQKLKVARIHNKITNQRNDYLHNISTNLVRNYDLIAIEDLNVEGMKHKFGKSVSDISLSTFINQLEYKSNWYGKTIVKIDRYYPSTQLCSSCNHKTGPKGIENLDKRTWMCNNCGMNHHRDKNAAINILKEGYKLLTSMELINNESVESPMRSESVEYIDYRRGEDIRQKQYVFPLHLLSSVKRLQI